MLENDLNKGKSKEWPFRQQIQPITYLQAILDEGNQAELCQSHCSTNLTNYCNIQFSPGEGGNGLGAEHVMVIMVL